ncbi:MAG: GyrI-like domain-containing protein [bacterium]|nr:GyrI-like domain-containing protein [bacterium]
MKKIVYVILGLLALYLLLALIGPKQVKVERHITINQPLVLVKEKLGDFKFFHDQWSPWSEKDPNMVNAYNGVPGEMGHHYSWSGNKDVGKGEMTLMGYNGDTLIQTLSFAGEGDAKSYFIMKDNTTSTDVTWGMVFPVYFFHRPIMLFMNMDKMVGGDYEKGLSKLKTLLEGMQTVGSASPYDVKEIVWEEKNFVGSKRTKLHASEMQKFFSDNYPKLGADSEKNKLQLLMAPCAIYYSWDDNTKDCEVAAVLCFPKGTGIKGWESHSFPRSKVLMVSHYGPYERIGSAYEAMEKYVDAKGLTLNASIEEYVTDPMSEKDSTKWLTNIYYLLK